MPLSVSFALVNDVMESWMLLQTIPNYSDELGVLMFRKFFDMYPDAVSLFSFGGVDKSMPFDQEEFFESPQFLVHVKLMMRTFCGAIDMLGPDLELLLETGSEIGQKHKNYGLTKEHYSFMELALIDALQELLGSSFTQHQRMAWEEFWKIFSYTMQHGRQNQ
eukprot:scaffold2499_cov125-Cylindrotheca_fusiformis.AAC.16